MSRKLQKDGVLFAVCSNTIRCYKLVDIDTLSTVSLLPPAIAETMLKQEEEMEFQKVGL